MSMLQYRNVWGGDAGPMSSIRNDYEYAKRSKNYLNICFRQIENQLHAGKMWPSKSLLALSNIK